MGDWLRSIAPAYHQYCAAFAEAAIDGFTLLAFKSEKAFEDLGVKNEAHRARLMADIKRYAMRSATSASAATRTGKSEAVLLVRLF